MNTIIKYSIEYHNYKNLTYDVFDTYKEAKTAYDACEAKDSFDIAQLYEVCWDNKDKPIYNLERLNLILNSYYACLHYRKLTTTLLEEKDIYSNNVPPYLDTQDIADYIDAVIERA